MANQKPQRKTVRLKLPVQDGDLDGLEIGTVVYLDGVIYTAREAVYKKVLEEGDQLPSGLARLSNVNFHCSPAAAVEPDGSYNVGGVTATASFRFSKWMPDWLERSKARVIIGKGGMSAEDYRDILVPAGAIYLTTVGYGTGALLGRGIKGVKAVHWLEELGNAQAMWIFEVENFGPFLVESDLAGNSLFEQQGRLINAKETDDRKDELI
jgi:L(+)-tartrate dehydratase beta subunit